MITKEILYTAMEQSAEDIGCKAEDFMWEQNIIIPFRLGDKARKYLKEPITANFVSYGSNVVAAAIDDIREIVTEYVGKYEFYHLFETPNMHWLSDRIKGKGYKICFMAEYFLPDTETLRSLPCDYELRVLVQPSHGIEPPARVRHQLRHGGPAPVVLHGGHISPGLIQNYVPPAAGLAQALAVQTHVVRIRVRAVPEARRHAVYRHPPGFDDLLRRPARGHPGAGDQFLQSLSHLRVSPLPSARPVSCSL